MAKTAKGLVAYAKAQLGKPYWYGTFGQAASESLYKQKKKQYPAYYLWAYDRDDAGKKVHDCVGLIKGYLWCDSNSDTAPAYKSAQDVSANGMLSACTKNGKISTMPDVPGVLVFMNKHVGIYIGDGYVIEARGHAYGVVKTKLSARAWKNWGYCPYVTYEEEKKEEETVNVDSAKKYTKSLAGTYKIKSSIGLKLRAGASTKKAILETMPNSSTVRCYGYHTGDWLYVVSASGKVGFCYKPGYLVKQK